MDTQAEMQRENETFEAGVKAYYDYIDANTEETESESYDIWAKWSRHHPSMSVDAQSEARVRWSYDQKKGGDLVKSRRHHSRNGWTVTCRKIKTILKGPMR